MPPEEERDTGFSGLEPSELLRLCIDAAPSGIAMFDTKMRYLAVNRPYRDSLGLGDLSLVGRSHYDIFPEIPPRWREIHRRCIAGATEHHDADPFVRSDGAVEWYRWSIHPWHDAAVAIGGIVMFLENVTDRMQAESERRLLAEAFEHAAFGMFIADTATGTIRFANRAYAGLCGADAMALRGTRVKDTFAPEALPLDADLLAKADGEGLAVFNSHFRRADGAVFPVQVQLTSVRDSAGDVSYRIGNVIDITEREQTEATLRQALKMDAVGQLTGGVAHDFNNLLTVILGNLEMLIDASGDDRAVVEFAGRAMAAAQRGERLTQQLLAYSRRQPLRPQRVDVNELVTGLADLFGRALGEQVKIVAHLAPDTWPINVDRSQLESALVNLATNARDAMPGGGVMTIATSNVAGRGDHAGQQPDTLAGDHVLIEVADKGGGILADLRTRIFEPFFTTKEPGKGTGLGLSMVYGFVRQSGGQVSVESEEGRGTVFRLRLPRAHVAEVGERSEAQAEPSPARGETVLAVEDNEQVRQMVTALLGRLGYRVLSAGTAAEALETLAEEPVDVLLSDIVMPGGMDGHELARIARQRWPALRILLTSGFAGGKLPKEARAFRLLQKPYRSAELACALREVIDEPRDVA